MWFILIIVIVIVIVVVVVGGVVVAVAVAIAIAIAIVIVIVVVVVVVIVIVIVIFIVKTSYKINTPTNWLKSWRYLAPKLWDLLPDLHRSLITFKAFKTVSKKLTIWVS